MSAETEAQASDAQAHFFEDMRVAAMGSMARHKLTAVEVAVILARLSGNLCGHIGPYAVDLAIANVRAGAVEERV
jgi:hypothetical protein